jgi:Tol biopolymer transport system component
VLGDLARYANPRLSPDGKRVAVIITDPQTRTRDIWLYEVARGLGTRFTFDPAEERAVTWSSDGSRIVFASDRKVHFDLYQKASSGASSEELLLESNLDKYPTSWSPDRRFLLYHTNDPKTRPDLWILPLKGDQKPFPFLQTEFSEDFGHFSPDGRWIAYNSDESRSTKIYVMPFPGPGGKRQVSTSGGRLPKWRGDGGEIFYLAPDNKLMAAEVNGLGATLEVGAVRVLFEVPLAGRGYVYDVTADGQRFLINTAVEKRASAPITLVLNWTADLKR